MKTFNIAKLGKNALTSTSPNDFIFNPSYNTPNIVKEAKHSPVLPTDASEQYTNIAHGLGYTPFCTAFCKFENSRVGLVGTKASDAEFFFTNLHVGASDVNFGYFNDTGGDYRPHFKYLATEIPLAGTPNIANPGGRRIVIAKSGFNALTETNPNNKIFDSQFGTMKYFFNDSATISIPDTTPAAGVADSYEQVLHHHNLGYYPVFGASLEYYVVEPGLHYVMPLMFADAGFWIYDMLYVTVTDLIFRREYGNSFGFTPMGGADIKLYYKIFSKDLAL